MGLTWTDERGAHYTPPTIIASDPTLAYSDGDIVRLNNGKLLCVLREHSVGGTFTSISDDNGATWSHLRDPGFVGASFKLDQLDSGVITCFYRDEDPARRGVSLSISEDSGESWEWVGQLYDAPDDAKHLPGYFGGGPDMVSLGNGNYAAVVHSYEDDDGEMCIHFMTLRERS